MTEATKNTNPHHHSANHLEHIDKFGVKDWIKSISIIIVLGLIGFYGFRYFTSHQKSTENDKKDAKRAAATVSAVPAKVSDINVYLSAIGTVIPKNNVVIHTRVDGQLMRVLFTEGQYVKQGELLAEIDSRPYQVQLAQAQGQLAKDQALLKNAQLDLDRYKKLLDQDSAPEQQVSTQNSLVNQYLGTIQTDQSQIDNAKLQISYTRVTSPISGRVGLRQVDAGNIVHQSDTGGILSIAQVKPITVIFSVPQDNLGAIMEPMRKGKKLPVEVFSRDQKEKLAEGILLSMDNQIDSTTGTVKLKAQFTNDDESLFPNQFVNVKVLTGVKKDAIVIPNAAVQRGAQGTFVYQVQADQTTTVKPVKVIVREGESAAIEGDIKAGDMIVTDGADKLREGAKVNLAKADDGKGNADKSGKPHHHKRSAE